MDAAVVAVGVWVSECVSVWWGIHIWHTYFGKSFCRTSTFHTFVSHHWYIFDEHIAISILWHLMKIQFAYLYIYIFYSILFSFIMFAHFYAYRSIVSLNISRSVLLFFFCTYTVWYVERITWNFEIRARILFVTKLNGCLSLSLSFSHTHTYQHSRDETRDIFKGQS